MTPIFDAEIEGPSAWRADAVGGKDGFVLELGAQQIAAIGDLMRATRGISTTQLTRERFDHPSLTPFLAQARARFMDEKGAVIIRGLDLGAWTEDEAERIFYGFGTHWGAAAVQSRRADRIGYVRNEPDDPVARGYRGRGELGLHTDSRPIIALLCMQQAASGGYSRLASAMTIHNIVRRERPDLLAPLYRGYKYLSKEIDAILPEIPVFSNVSGVVSCYVFEDHMRRAAIALNEPFPEDLDEALAFFDSVAQRSDVSLEFMLEPGEIMVCNNFVVLHARTAFEDSQTMRRLLLRLWLNLNGERPTLPSLLERSRRFDVRFDPRHPDFMGETRADV